MDGNGGTGLVLHGPDVPDDVVAAQFFGAHHAAQREGSHNAAPVCVAELGDDLGHPLGHAVEGDNHIELIQTRQGHQGVTLRKPLAVQQILVRSISVDDLRIGEQSAELLAPGGIAFHDDTADTGLLQSGCQIVADPSAAAEHDPPDLPGENAQVFQQSGQVLGKGGDKQPVTLPQNKVAAGGNGGAPPQDGADQNLAADNGPHVCQPHIAQLAAAVYPEFYDLRPALGEGIPPQEARVFEQPVNFRGGLIFGIDEHGQAKKLPHLENLFRVLRVPDPGDGVQFGVHGVGGGAA